MTLLIPSHQATWGDYDRDGWVDLLIANTAEDRANILYHNNGDGTFSDVTFAAGISGPAYTRAAIGGDYNNDSWPDIYVHGIQESVLYTNSRGGFFSHDNKPSALDGFNDGLACAWRDIDNNGFLDLTLGARDASMRLLINQNGRFDLDNSFFPGTIPRNSGGATYIDIDNDGYPDLYSKELYGKEYLFKNSSGTRFIDITDEAGFTSGSNGGNAVCADLDNDGDMDLVAAQFDPHRLFYYENALEVINPSSHYLDVELTGTQSNRSGIGTRVIVFAGGTLQMQEKTCGESGIAQSTPRLHFGLKDYTSVDSLLLYWPSGIRQKVGATGANQIVTILEDGPNVGVEYSRNQNSSPEAFTLRNFPNPFNPTTRIKYTLPSKSYVSLKIFNLKGELKRTLVEGEVGPGDQSVQWDGSDESGRMVPAGIYLCQLKSESSIKSIRMLFLK